MSENECHFFDRVFKSRICFGRWDCLITPDNPYFHDEEMRAHNCPCSDECRALKYRRNAWVRRNRC